MDKELVSRVVGRVRKGSARVGTIAEELGVTVEDVYRSVTSSPALMHLAGKGWVKSGPAPVGHPAVPPVVKDRMTRPRVEPIEVPTDAEALRRVKARKYDEIMVFLRELLRPLTKDEKVAYERLTQAELVELEELKVVKAEGLLVQAQQLGGSGGIQKWGSGQRQEQPETKAPRKVVVQSAGREVQALEAIKAVIPPIVDPFSDPAWRQEMAEVARMVDPAVLPNQDATVSPAVRKLIQEQQANVRPPVVPALTSDQSDGLAGVVGARVTPKKDGGLFEPL